MAFREIECFRNPLQIRWIKCRYCTDLATSTATTPPPPISTSLFRCKHPGHTLVGVDQSQKLVNLLLVLLRRINSFFYPQLHL